MGISLKSIGKNLFDGGAFKALSGGLGGINLGDPFDFSGQKAREYNSAEAQKQRNWEQSMSDTAHQREVADLEKAGLNPILSATGGQGASTPSGSSASTSQGEGAQALSALIGAISGIKQTQTSAKATKSQAELNNMYERNIENEIKNRDITTATHVTEMQKTIEHLNAQIEKTMEETRARRQSNDVNENLGISDNETGVNRTGAYGVKGQKGVEKANLKLNETARELRGLKKENKQLSKENQKADKEILLKLARSNKMSQAELASFKYGDFQAKIRIAKRAKARGVKL